MDSKILKSLAFTVVVILLFTQKSDGIKCYRCGPSQGTTCNDPFDQGSFSSVECGDVSCQKVKATVGDAQSVERNCAGAKQDSDACNKGEIAGASTETCFCNTDECNAAVTSKISMIKVLAISSGIFLFKIIL